MNIDKSKPVEERKQKFSTTMMLKRKEDGTILEKDDPTADFTEFKGNNNRHFQGAEIQAPNL